MCSWLSHERQWFSIAFCMFTRGESKRKKIGERILVTVVVDNSYISYVFLQTLWPPWGALTVGVKARCSALMTCPCAFPLRRLAENKCHRALVKRSCQATSYRDLPNGAIVEIFYKILPGDLSRRCCTETRWREQRSSWEIPYRWEISSRSLPRDLLS